MPTSAAASAGASLMPSPTIATTWPPARNCATAAALSPGSTSARTSVMPSSRATTSALPRLSPVSITVLTPSACNPATAAWAVGLTVSPKASRPSTSSAAGAAGPLAAAWRCAGGSGSSRISQETVRPCACSACAVAASPPGAPPRSASSRLLPRRSSAPSTRPCRPRPGSACTSVAPCRARASTAARARSACASGCSLSCCKAAARRSTSVSERPAAPCTATSTGRPSVSVPVLSKATVVVACASSSACASLIRMPWRAATPVPAMMAVGVARPSAHGQAITSTDTALMSAVSTPVPAASQPSNVISAKPSTTGTKTALTRSTARWMGAFAACADSTSRITRASVVSAPTAVVRSSRAPSVLMAPPVTRSPGPLATGMLSPVIRDSSTWLRPSSTSPSTAMRSPGRTRTRSPRTTASTATSASTPSRSTRAVAGRNNCSARIAEAVSRLARPSSHLPRSTRVTTTAALSKYRCGSPWEVCASSRYSDRP